MTNHWIDLKNSDVILVCGSNPAENHPISFRWVTEAMKRGGTLIHVDPRFTRTSAKADIWAAIRSGSDTAFWSGFISYIIENNLYFEEYVREYTNAPFILGDGYGFSDGLFSGFAEDTRSYDKSRWAFALDENGNSKTDPSLRDPRCVFQVAKRHYARYTPSITSALTGIPEDELRNVWDTFAATGKPDKAGTILYAMGQCQHSVGVQNIRALAIVQLLLGNIGVAGGGVNALRGESNVQGTTDIALIADNLPGYLAPPKASQRTLADYIKANTPVTHDKKSVNWWGNYPKYIVSYLKSIYPEHDHETSYAWLPKVDDVPLTEYTWLNIFERMKNGLFKGAFVWGQNPAAGGANAGKNRKALETLNWMVAVNIFTNETSEFWKAPGINPADVKTEVFFLPACVSVEKDGSFANSGRWLQWRFKAAQEMGQSRSDGDIIMMLQAEVKKLYARQGALAPEPVLNLDLDFAVDGKYDASRCARRINGQYLRDVTEKGVTAKAGQQVPGFAALKDDGSTACGCWIFAGSYTDAGNMMARQSLEQTPEQARIGLFPNWSFAWPANRRIIYNRAGVDAAGRPFNPEKAVIRWDGEKWLGDVPDGGGAPGAVHPYIMIREGRGQIFGPGRADGPLPEHYEPFESPLKENPFSSRRHNPSALHFPHEPMAVADPRYPYVCTTYRLTEHWQSGTISRAEPWLVEMQPDGFCEISLQLADELGISNGEPVIVESLRGSIQVTALVTRRMKPLTVMGATVHTVGLPWHFGWHKRVNGAYDSANLLSPSVGDPNTGIPETKTFMVNVRRAGGTL